MLNRIASAMLIAALVCTLGGPPTFAGTRPKPDSKGAGESGRADAGDKAGGATEERLRGRMLTLINDAKAEAALPNVGAQQAPAPQVNHLSKGTKIAIGVAVAVVVVVAIVIATKANDGPTFRGPIL